MNKALLSMIVILTLSLLASFAAAAPDFRNITLPDMTSPVIPPPYIVIDTQHFATTPAFGAWTPSLTVAANEVWASGTNEIANMTMDFGPLNTTIRVTNYTIQSTITDFASMSEAWEIMVSDDNITYTVVDTQSGQTGWASAQARSFGIDTPTPGRYFLWRNLLTDDGGQIRFGYIRLVHDANFEAAPAFTAVVNNATSDSTTGDDVNWTTTITDDGELSFCWFTHNDSGTFANSTVQSCTTPFIFDETITLAAGIGDFVCGFFTANNTANVHAQTPNSCFTLGESTPPQFTSANNNASSAVINDVVQFTINITDNFALGSWTFGSNGTGSFTNITTTFLNGETAVNLSVNQTIPDPPDQFVCGRFYFNDTSGNENVSESCFTTTNLFRINITAFNALTNETINTFTAAITGITNISFFTTSFTTTGILPISLSAGNYSVITNATTFSNGTGFLNITAPTNGSFSMFPDPSSISLTILREGNGSLITQRVDIEVLGPTVDTTFNTSSGLIFMGGLESGTLAVVVSSAGFSTRNYFVTLAPADHTDLTARLLNTTVGTVQEVTFTIKDSADAAISGATMTVGKRINATFFPIGQRITDISGQIVFDLDSTIIYEFTITADTFTPRQFQLLPTQTTYDIILTPTAALNFTSVFDFISYTTAPGGSLVTAVPTDFTFTTTSAVGAIQFFGFNISVGNISEATNITGSPSGASTTLTINLSGLEGQTVTGQYFIQASGFSLFEFNRTFFVGQNLTPGRTTFVGAAEEHGDEFSAPMKALVAVGISAVAAVALSPLIGVTPAALGALAVQIGFVVIGWIAATHAILMGIVLGGVWLLLGRRSQ